MSRIRTIGAAAALLLALSAQSPLPGGVIEDKARATERESRQVGGEKPNRYSFVGALRCDGFDALVGLRIARSGFLDAVQAICAEVGEEKEQGAWTTVYPGKTAGSHGAAATVIEMRCPLGAMLSGFRASVDADFARDVEIECAAITGIGQKGLYAVDARQRQWAKRDTPPERRPAIEAHCRRFGSTGVSLAVGARPGGGSAVQAFSMFCGGTDPVGEAGG